MHPKERLMRALARQKPDRLPITIHQWQPYHLKEYMGGRDQLEAFLATGLDASITPWPIMSARSSPEWRVSSEQMPRDERGAVETRHRVETPSGVLTYRTCADPITTFFTEHIAKNLDEAGLFLRHWPGQTLDREQVSSWYDRTGDRGIVRGFVCSWNQPGVWQDFVELMGTQEAIMLALDEPERVHGILDTLTRIKVAFVHEQLRGAKYDLIEHGGGAASSTVISPSMFDEFCVPYDRRIIEALHACGFPVVYHTCGGMVPLVEKIPNNGCDASETLSPPGVGGDISREKRTRVKTVLGAKVALIGGMDQFNILTTGTPARIRSEVFSLFEDFGGGGGYVCSASDHFFETPPENLKAFAEAARECVY